MNSSMLVLCGPVLILVCTCAGWPVRGVHHREWGRTRELREVLAVYQAENQCQDAYGEHELLGSGKPVAAASSPSSDQPCVTNARLLAAAWGWCCRAWVTPTTTSSAIWARVLTGEGVGWMLVEVDVPRLKVKMALSPSVVCPAAVWRSWERRASTNWAVRTRRWAWKARWSRGWSACGRPF